MSKFENCLLDAVGEYCFFHECGPTDPEQCGKEECPHCTFKTIREGKLQLTNSFLKAKDIGEIT